LLALIVGAPSE